MLIYKGEVVSFVGDRAYIYKGEIVSFLQVRAAMMSDIM